MSVTDIAMMTDETIPIVTDGRRIGEMSKEGIGTARKSVGGMTTHGIDETTTRGTNATVIDVTTTGGSEATRESVHNSTTVVAAGTTSSAGSTTKRKTTGTSSGASGT